MPASRKAKKPKKLGFKKSAVKNKFLELIRQVS
jgi:hypothetical protein